MSLAPPPPHLSSGISTRIPGHGCDSLLIYSTSGILVRSTVGDRVMAMHAASLELQFTKSLLPPSEAMRSQATNGPDHVHAVTCGLGLDISI